MNNRLREIDQQSTLKKLQGSLGYTFQDQRLLVQALTHKSATSTHNERLEFLGDSILNTSITIYLYENFPELDEGRLSRIRASLVKGETLAKIAKFHQVGNCLNLGLGELKSGGHQRDSILADALEAIIGAVFLEAGFNKAQVLVLSLYEERLQKDFIENLGKDSKSALQEYLQARQLALPVYSVDSIDGKDHQQEFTIACEVESRGIRETATAKNRKTAEKKVARIVLEKLQQLDERKG